MGRGEQWFQGPIAYAAIHHRALSCEKTQCADVVGDRTLQNAVTKEIDLSGSATDINVEVGTMTIGNTLEMVAINDACFFAAVDDFDIDTGVFRNLANDGSAVFASRMAEVAQAR